VHYSFDSIFTDCYVYCDATQISQVILNILKNAAESIEAKHALEGFQGEVKVSLINYKEGFINVLIEDNGMGIEPEVLNRIFEPYVTTKVKGTGLGLSIVKKIVEEHGGQISIHSNKNGAKVSILLKLYSESEDTNA
jgi:two-component system nitrogen regulation sensor histidine kinase NtrY